MKTIKNMLLAAAIAGLCLTVPAVRAETLTALDAEYVAEIQRNSQTVSHREGLKNTIERLLDCSAGGRIEVALVGMAEVPDWVVDAWVRHEAGYAEVSISRYGMFLDVRQPTIRTDFYRFRTVRGNGEVAETLFQNIRKDKKAAMIFTFVDGDPTGKDKALATVLESLLAAVEEGQVTAAAFAFGEVPQRVAQLWKKYAPEKAENGDIRVQRFNAETAGGEDIYWRLYYGDAESGAEQTMLIVDDRMVYCEINGRIIVE